MSLPMVEWFPPDGSGPITFGVEGDFRLLRFDGATSTRTAALLRKSVGQVGSTAVDRTVSERTVGLQCLVESVDLATFNDDIATLVHALAGVPGTESRPQLGTLRVHYPGRPVVEALAEPVDSPQEVNRARPDAAIVDIEWVLPSPLWRETTDQIVTLFPAPDNPWTSPWTSPWVSPAAQTSAGVNNAGDVPAGIRVRFFGPQTTVRLVNASTGEQLQVFGAISASEIVEVDTDARTVTVDGVSALGRWDFDGTWWRLRRGMQTVVAQANSADSTSRTVVLWRPAYAGV